VTTTTPVSTVGGPAGTTLNADKSKSSVYGLGKDDFMKLFLAQLQNQDPTQPADDKEMVTEMAQFTMIDTLQQVATALAGTQLAQSSAMIGRHIQGMDANGKSVSGVVDRIVQSSDAGLVLMVGDQPVKPDGVQIVTDATSSSDSGSTGGATDPGH
jgi:flagellar basal-body rod modification protein FlgD